MEQLKHIDIRISGRVQGVGFRYSAMSAARSLGVAGFAKNIANGEVYIEAEAKPEALEAFLAWCKTGPKMAKVSHVMVNSGEVAGYHSFEIKA